jgi:3-hydroxyacyl-CoA dehydrogenase
LASHYRCASRDLHFGLPEVKVGLLPGAGGTVRLPRLVGVKQALDMMTSGDPIGLARAIELGIVDKAVGDDIRSEAIAWAAELAATGAPVRRLRDAPIPDASAATPAWFAQYREAMPRAARKLPAPERIVQCVEAAVNLPFDAAMGKARELFEPCRTSAESRSLRHLFFAERGAPVQGEIRPVASVGVIGSGTMGAGIAISLATGGYSVTLVDANATALEAGLQRVRRRSMRPQEGPPERRCRSAGHRSRERQRRLCGARDRRSRDRAVFEKMSVKQEVFAQLGQICKPGAVLATNTSTLDVDAIAAASGRAQDVVGMHFFSPANIMRLVEIVRGRETSMRRSPPPPRSRNASASLA